MKDTAKPDQRRIYDAAFRAEALRLAEQSRSTEAAARALNIGPKASISGKEPPKRRLLPLWARHWTRPRPPNCAVTGIGLAAGTGAGDLRKSHRQQTLKARYLADAGLMSRYRFIAAERGHYPVRRLCQVLGMPPNGYYAWQAGQQPVVGPSTPMWETALVKAFRYPKRRYGTRRLQVVLRQNGHRVGSACERPYGGGACTRYSPRLIPRAQTDSTHGLRCAPNRLLDQPKPTQANQVWVPDITYVPLADGCWTYLCAFQNM